MARGERAASKNTANTMTSVTYVLIPANNDEPMQEMQLPVPEQLEENISALTTALNSYYRATAGVASGAGKQKLIDDMRAKGNALGDDVLDRFAESQTCDIVQLLPSTAASGWMGVNLYVDDKGVAKGSPLNARASAICGQCGLPTEVRGDAFVAKLWDDQEGFVRHDFTLADCASDAAWVVEAQARNANRTDPQAAMARLQPGGDLGGGAAAGPAQPELGYEERLEQAAAARAAGTDAFKAGDVDAAAEKYAAALALWTPMPPPPSIEDPATGQSATDLVLACCLNLAACRLKQGKPYEAIAACDRALELDESAAKGWYRRGQACVALGQYGAAVKDLTKAGQLNPSSREIRAELDAAKARAAEKRQAGVAGMFGAG